SPRTRPRRFDPQPHDPLVLYTFLQSLSGTVSAKLAFRFLTPFLVAAEVRSPEGAILKQRSCGVHPDR
ncbi:MAG: hypothetical protein ACKO81_11120, partial [Planctomycetota bacterium]